MASKKGNKKSEKKVGQVSGNVIGFVKVYEKEEFIRVMGGKFLSAGYSMEEGMKHALATKTISLGLLKKVLAKLGIFDSSTTTNFEECEKALSGWLATNQK